MKLEISQTAVAMRRSGKSIKEIARELNVSQSSVSRWCAGITLTESQRSNLESRRKEAGMKALRPWIEKNKTKKEQDIEKQHEIGEKDLGNVSDRDFFIMGLGLYWGEGYKRGSQEWGFTNSDPIIIRALIQWMNSFYEVKMARFIVRLTINEIYKHESARLMKFWSEETKIPLNQFGKPTFIKGYGKTDRDPKTYRGTLRLKIRNSTSLRRRILASIEAFGNQISWNSRKTFS